MKFAVSHILVLLMAMPVITNADDTDSVFSHPVTQKNEPQFMQEVRRIQLHGEVQKEFTQEKRIAALKRPLISRGSIVLSHKGICLSTRSPFSGAVKITLDGISQQSGNRKATVKSAADHFEIKHTARILIALFSADKVVLENQFSLHYQRTDDRFQIGLRPKDRILAKIISNIVIEGTDEIRRIAIREANGDETTILISDEPSSQKITLETCIR